MPIYQTWPDALASKWVHAREPVVKRAREFQVGSSREINSDERHFAYTYVVGTVVLPWQFSMDKPTSVGELSLWCTDTVDFALASVGRSMNFLLWRAPERFRLSFVKEFVTHFFLVKDNGNFSSHYHFIFIFFSARTQSYDFKSILRKVTLSYWNMYSTPSYSFVRHVTILNPCLICARL